MQPVLAMLGTKLTSLYIDVVRVSQHPGGGMMSEQKFDSDSVYTQALCLPVKTQNRHVSSNCLISYNQVSAATEQALQTNKTVSSYWQDMQRQQITGL